MVAVRPAVMQLFHLHLLAAAVPHAITPNAHDPLSSPNHITPPCATYVHQAAIPIPVPGSSRTAAVAKADSLLGLAPRVPAGAVRPRSSYVAAFNPQGASSAVWDAADGAVALDVPGRLEDLAPGAAFVAVTHSVADPTSPLGVCRCAWGLVEVPPPGRPSLPAAAATGQAALGEQGSLIQI